MSEKLSLYLITTLFAQLRSDIFPMLSAIQTTIFPRFAIWFANMGDSESVIRKACRPWTAGYPHVHIQPLQLNHISEHHFIRDATLMETR